MQPGRAFSKWIPYLTVSFCFGHTPQVEARTGKLLEGSVKQDASLHASLKVFAAPEHAQSFPPIPRQELFPLDAELEQFKGGVRYVGGKPAPLQSVTPNGAGRARGVIPPLSNYSVVHGTALLWVAPGYEINFSKTTTRFASSGQNTRPSMTKGVTSWDSDYEITPVNNSSPASLPIPFSTAQGVTAWQREYERFGTPRPTKSCPEPQTGQIALRQSSQPNYQVSYQTSRSGVICWTPGYEVSIQTPGLIKTSLGGLWCSTRNWPPSTPNFPNPRTFLEAVPASPSLVATPLLLPELRPKTTDKNLDWDGWYKQIAKAVYSRWQFMDVGPGLATVRVTVTKARDLSCRLVDFAPAEGMQRNIIAETSFREAAVRAVNDVHIFEIPQLPSLSRCDEVTFDVDMKRTIDGPIGIDIAIAHGIGSGKSSRP